MLPYLLVQALSDLSVVIYGAFFLGSVALPFFTPKRAWVLGAAFFGNLLGGLGCALVSARAGSEGGNLLGVVFNAFLATMVVETVLRYRWRRRTAATGV